MPLFQNQKLQSGADIRRWMVVMGLSIIMGLLGGLTAALVKFLIEKVTWLFREKLLPLITIPIGDYNLGLVFLPIIGGLLVGVIIHFYGQELKGSGIPVLLETMTFKRAEISPNVGVFKTIASAITLGSGGNAGKEGPIALIAASFGSFFGKLLKLKPEDKRLIMTCGLAAGIAGSFNAPIGGALFGLEILYQGITVFSSIPVFLAAAVGVLVTGNIFGFQKFFEVEVDFGSVSPVEYSFFLLMGAVFGLLTYGLMWLFQNFNRGFSALRVPRFLKPALGGVIVGIILIFFPSNGLYGTGFEGIQEALDGNLTLALFLALGILKVISMYSTITSGGSGGVFAPLLFIGCMFGGAYGQILELIFPNTVSNPILFCILGAACLFAAFAQAPLNICLMLVEMTQHFEIFPPMMITSITSFLVARIFMKGGSIYTFVLGEKGFGMKSDTIHYLSTTQVHEVMSTNLVTVSPNLPILEFAHISSQHHHMNQYPVMNFGRLEGIVYVDSLYTVSYETWGEITVKEIMDSAHISIPSKFTLQEAMDFMNEYHKSAVLVVDIVEAEGGEEGEECEEDHVLKGILTMKDIIHAWGPASAKKMGL